MSNNAAIGNQTVWAVGLETAGYGLGVLADLTRFLRVLPDESVARRNTVIQPEGIQGGVRNAAPSAGQVVTAHDAAGDVSFEVATQDFGLMFECMMGQKTITALGGAPAAYQQVYELGWLFGKSLITQKQVKRADGTVIQTVTHRGVKITAAEFTVNARGILVVRFSVDAREERTDIAAAAPVYTTPWKVFHFQQCTVRKGGVALAALLSGTIRVENPMGTEDFFLGNAGLKDEPVAAEDAVVSASLQGRIIDTGLYAEFAANTSVSIEVAYVGDVISGLNNESIVFRLPDARVTEDQTPKISSKGVLERPIPLRGYKNAAGDSALEVEYVTKDAAA